MTSLDAIRRADAAVKAAAAKLDDAERARSQAILAAVDAGAKQTTIAAELGVSRETLRQWLMVARAREGR
jgi:DNA-binding transcriptional regulator LsrR (DeoR family)